MITWKQEGSTWVGYIGESRAFKLWYENIDGFYFYQLWHVKFIKTDTLLANQHRSADTAKQAAEDFAAEMKQLFNTKEL